jgi:serine/threonine-protein kinase
MSAVYLGYDTAGGRHVAVKLLADHLADNPDAVRRFSREARLSRTLVHPSLVRGLAGGLDPVAGKHFLILEFVDGPSALTRLTRGGPLPLPAVARLAADVGSALRHLHGRSLIHRDVKPDNILLAPDGSAKLADLGLARRVKAGRPAEPDAPSAAGTPHYMPPEQVIDCDRVEPRSDLYALGATLYHLLTGAVPFDGASQDELLRQKLGGGFRLASQMRPELPGSVDLVLGRLLAADPAARYQTAGELLTAVRDHFGPPAPLQPYALTELPEPNPLADTDPGRTHIDLPASLPKPPRPGVGLVLLATVVAAGLAARSASSPADKPASHDKPPAAQQAHSPATVQTRPHG